MIRILALADDLTGALETGARFAAEGIAAPVTVAADPDAVVIDTETRHLAPAAAAARVFELASAARARGVRLIYKKTDSTLRGNIAAELGALLAAWPGARAVYAPAYPAMGRTVRSGTLYVNGTRVSETEFARDPLNPVRESHIPSLLGHSGIQVFDGETDDDVDRAARLIVEEGCPIAAGPAALASALARLLPAERTAPRPWPRVRRCLVVNGSYHSASLAQITCARERGWPVADDPRGVTDWAISASTAPDVSLETGLDALAVFGGDTAFALVRALRETRLEPIGEILPGVAVSTAGRLTLITKAGGFGAPDLLPRLRDLLGR